jgi:hypothetical protein
VCNFCTFKTLPDRVYVDGRRYNIYVSETEQVDGGIEAIVSGKGWSKSDIFREAFRTYVRQDANSNDLAQF